MVAKFVFVALALVCVAQARVARDAPATDHFDDIVKAIKTGIDDTSKKINEIFGVKNTDELVQNAKKTANDVAESLNAAIKKLAEEGKKQEPEIRKHLKPYQDKLQEIVSKLEKENPEATASAKKIQENTDAVVAKISEESKKLVESFKSSKFRAEVETFAKESLEKVAKATTELKEKIEKKP